MKVSIERRIAITAVSLALIGFTGSVPARADSEVTTTTETITTPMQTVTAPGYITIERPVVLQNSEVIKEKEVRYITRRASCSHRTAMKRTAVRKIAARPLLKTNKNFISEKVIDRTIEKPIMIEKPVIVKEFLPPPAIETRSVQVEQPVVIEKKVLVQPAVIEDQPTIIMKGRHHLLHIKIPFAGLNIL